MKNSYSKKDLIILLTALCLLVSFFFVLFFKEERIKEEINEEINKLPYNYESICSHDLVRRIENYRKGVASYNELLKTRDELVFFNQTHLMEEKWPTVYIYSYDGNGNNLKNYHGKKEARIVFVDSNGDVIDDDNCIINVRGNSTSGGDKRPYNIKFSKKVNILGFGKNKKWSLLAECFDPTMIRNKLFFELAKEMELEYTPESEYVKVYMDDVYKGCYLLTERVNASISRVDIDVYSGDFIFEYEEEREDKDTVYINSDNDWRFRIVDPDEPDYETEEYMHQSINLFDNAVYSGDYKNVRNTIDVESFAKFYLLNEFAKNIDFDYSSVKFYKKNGIIYAGPVWDFDISSGNYSINYYPDAWEGESPEEKDNKKISYAEFVCTRNPIFDRLMEYPEFRSLVNETFEKYYSLFESSYSDGGMIDQLTGRYRELFETNYSDTENGGAGWVIFHTYSGLEFEERGETYDENIEYLRTWLKDRLNWMKENMWQE